MRFFNANHNLLLLFLILLIIQPINAVPPQELCAEPCQTYAIVCFISFCLGAVLCALIHKYCVHQPVIPVMEKRNQESSYTRTMTDKQLLENLQANIAAMREQQEKAFNILTEQKKTGKNLTTNNIIKLSLCMLITQTSLAIEKNNQLFTKIVHLNQGSCGYILVPVTYYWMNKYKEQKNLLEQFQQKSPSAENQSLLPEKAQ